MKTKTVKTIVKLDEQEQAQRKAVIDFVASQGLPPIEAVIDSVIYRTGLETFYKQAEIANRKS